MVGSDNQSPKTVLKATISTVLDAFDVEPNIGSLLRTFRQNHQLSQSYIAERLDVSKNFIHDVELGHRSFSIEKLRKLLFFITTYPDPAHELPPSETS